MMIYVTLGTALISPGDILTRPVNFETSVFL